MAEYNKNKYKNPYGSSYQDRYNTPGNNASSFLNTLKQSNEEETNKIPNQIANYKQRLAVSGYDPEDVADSRNWIEKALNLTPDQHFIFDTLEILNRPTKAVLGMLSEGTDKRKFKELTSAQMESMSLPDILEYNKDRPKSGPATFSDILGGAAKGLSGKEKEKYTGKKIVSDLLKDGEVSDKFDPLTSSLGYGLEMMADPLRWALIAATGGSSEAVSMSGAYVKAKKLIDTAKGTGEVVSKTKDTTKLVKTLADIGKAGSKAVSTDDLVNVAKNIGKIDMAGAAQSITKAAPKMSGAFTEGVKLTGKLADVPGASGLTDGIVDSVLKLLDTSKEAAKMSRVPQSLQELGKLTRGEAISGRLSHINDAKNPLVAAWRTAGGVMELQNKVFSPNWWLASKEFNDTHITALQKAVQGSVQGVKTAGITAINWRNDRHMANIANLMETDPELAVRKAQEYVNLHESVQSLLGKKPRFVTRSKDLSQAKSGEIAEKGQRISSKFGAESHTVYEAIKDNTMLDDITGEMVKAFDSPEEVQKFMMSFKEMQQTAIHTSFEDVLHTIMFGPKETDRLLQGTPSVTKGLETYFGKDFLTKRDDIIKISSKVPYGQPIPEGVPFTYKFLDETFNPTNYNRILGEVLSRNPMEIIDGAERVADITNPFGFTIEHQISPKFQKIMDLAKEDEAYAPLNKLLKDYSESIVEIQRMQGGMLYNDPDFIEQYTKEKYGDSYVTHRQSKHYTADLAEEFTDLEIKSEKYAKPAYSDNMIDAEKQMYDAQENLKQAQIAEHIAHSKTNLKTMNADQLKVIDELEEYTKYFDNIESFTESSEAGAVFQKLRDQGVINESTTFEEVGELWDKIRTDARDAAYKFDSSTKPLSFKEIEKTISEKIPQTTRKGWYSGEHSWAKNEIERLALADPELRNAGLSLAHKQFNDMFESNLTFQEFLDRDITLFRGSSESSGFIKDGVMNFSKDSNYAYSFKKDSAAKFAGRAGVVDEITVKGNEILGVFNANLAGEGEVFLRRGRIEPPMSAKIGEYGYGTKGTVTARNVKAIGGPKSDTSVLKGRGIPGTGYQAEQVMQDYLVDKFENPEYFEKRYPGQTKQQQDALVEKIKNTKWFNDRADQSLLDLSVDVSEAASEVAFRTELAIGESFDQTNKGNFRGLRVIAKGERVPIGYTQILPDDARAVLKNLKMSTMYTQSDAVDALSAQIDSALRNNTPIYVDAAIKNYVVQQSRLDMDGFLDALNDYTNNWKKLKVSTPAYQMRNITGNVYNAAASGQSIPDALGGVETARLRMKQLGQIDEEGSILWKYTQGLDLTSEEQHILNIRNDLRRAGFMGDDFQYRFEGIKEDGQVGQLGRSELYKKPRGEKNKLFKGLDKATEINMKLNQDADNLFRMSTYQYALDHPEYMRSLGVSKPIDAVRLVHFDMSEMTGLEERVIKKIVPFYNFNRQNLRFQLKNLVRDPNRFRKFNKDFEFVWDMAGVDTKDMKSWERENYYLPDPIKMATDALGITKKEDSQYRTLKSNLPISDVFDWAQSSPQAFMASLNPAIRAPFEMSTGKEIFSGEEIGDKISDKLKYAWNLTGYDTPMRVPEGIFKAVTGDIEGGFDKATSMFAKGDTETTRSMKEWEEYNRLKDFFKMLSDADMALPTLTELRRAGIVEKKPRK